jgi:hypothetical protein
LPNPSRVLPKCTQCAKLSMMKAINWNVEKSQFLKQSRGICFEDIVFHIGRGDVLDDYCHKDQQKYPGQRIMVVRVDNHVFLVPYVETEDELFLKTIIPSRKATQRYLGERNEDKSVKGRKRNP